MNPKRKLVIRTPEASAAGLARLEKVTHRVGLYNVTVGRNKREYFKRRPERVSARSIAAEAWEVATRIPEPEHKVFRPKKGSKSPRSSHYVKPEVNARGLDAETVRRLNDQAVLARMREACASTVTYRNTEND